MSNQLTFCLGDKVAIACDHAGYIFKDVIIKELIQMNFEVINLGTNNLDSVDYPDYGEILGNYIKDKKAVGGVLICGTGIGISIAANRIHNVRAALVHNLFTAEMSRVHNNANVIALGSRVIDEYTAVSCVNKFFSTSFEGGRHKNRIDKLDNINSNKKK